MRVRVHERSSAEKVFQIEFSYRG